MDPGQHRLMQPASREQIVAIIRQRAERNRGAVVIPPPPDMDPRNHPPPPRLRPGYVPYGAIIADAAAAGGGALPRIAGAVGPLSASSENDASSSSLRSVNVKVRGDKISYQDRGENFAKVGLFIGGKEIRDGNNYAEIEIVQRKSNQIRIGLCSKRFPDDIHAGWESESVGYHTGEGLLFRGGPRGQPFGPPCDVGDRIGVGVKPSSSTMAPVFFTRNGKEIGTILMPYPPGGFFPIVSMDFGEEVIYRQDLIYYPPEEDSSMMVDCGEDEWIRLHDIRMNGQILEYIGRGRSLVDVGLAQAKSPICTRNHYFEIEIVDPGANCYIAIGLARKDYPKNRHPGWNKGSIAYHADDGKVFVGSGGGSPFGPHCNKGDVMGCGILFPRNYECRSDSEEEIEQQGGGGGLDQYGEVIIDQDYSQLDDYGSDSGGEEEWWNDRSCIQSGVKVQIYFTRNGKVIGKKDIRIPKGGFYPTVGMMSVDEKVRVDLRPLSG